MYPSHEKDSYGWAIYTAQLLKEKRMNEVDFDGIIEEPLGGAHYEPQVAFDHLKHSIVQNIKAFASFSGQELEQQRQDKFIAMGQFKG